MKQVLLCSYNEQIVEIDTDKQSLVCITIKDTEKESGKDVILELDELHEFIGGLIHTQQKLRNIKKGGSNV